MDLQAANEQQKRQIMIAKAQNHRRMVLDDEWQAMLETLRIDDIHMQETKAGKCWHIVSSVFGFVLILACEMDIIGFCLACLHYWYAGSDGIKLTGSDESDYVYPSTTNYLMHLLLCLGPLGYAYSITKEIVEVCAAEQAKKGVASQLKQPLIRADSLASDPGDIEALPFVPVRKLPKRPEKLGNEPFRLKWVHCIPVIRNKLFLSGIGRNDVEGLFRSNVLSTFTLGVAQLGCLALGTAAGILDVHNILVRVGLIAQGLNLLVTFFHFGTSVPQYMKVGADVDNMTSYLQQTLREEQIEYCAAVAQYRDQADNADLSKQCLAQLTYFANRAEREIRELSGTTIDCSMFTMDDKFSLRQKLRVKSVASYAATATM
jgi:Ni,Fe-hydrogenase III component G